MNRLLVCSDEDLQQLLMRLTLMGTGSMSILAIVLTRMLVPNSCVYTGTFGEHEKGLPHFDSRAPHGGDSR